VAAAIGAGASAAGWTATELPLSDGGEGLLEVTGGANQWSLVTGPLGEPTTAAWRLDTTHSPRSDGSGRGPRVAARRAGAAQAPPRDQLPTELWADPRGGPTAVIEMSQAAGLVLAGGPERNDAVAATTTGVGELILHAVRAGAQRIVVGCGGSASTDGGAGAIAAIGGPGQLVGVEVVVACDVTVGFLGAAHRFGPQKGASPQEVELLERRLSDLADRYVAEFGRDVRSLDGAGAAGGLAGGLFAIGASLVAGFELVAALVHLDGEVRRAGAVVTGEGCLDDQSFAGKVDGGVAGRAGERPVLCVAGRVTRGGRTEALARGLDVVSLSERVGEETAMARPLGLVADVTAAWLSETRP